MYKKSSLNFLLLNLLLINITTHLNAKEIHHKPIQVPDGIDGTDYGINGHEIKKLLFITKRIQQLLHGIQDPVTKEHKNQYYFCGNAHNVTTLAEFELAHPEMNHEIRKELNEVLERIKNDFIDITYPFVTQARDVKRITIRFIEQWSEHHNKKDSALLDWSKEKDGKEFDLFRAKITNFVLLQEFCSDLVSFISDLVQSCPRAWKEFIELQSKGRAKK